MQLLLQIADHFETLASGKVLAVGLFADRVVVMHVPADAPEPTPEVPFATDLGLLLTICHAPATPLLQGEAHILPPGGGAPVVALPFSGLSIKAGGSANIITKLKPLIVPRAGMFTVEVHIGSEVLRAQFEIRIERLPARPATDPAAVEVPGAPPPPAKRRAAAGRRQPKARV